MTKATTSAIDFLAAISGGTEEFEVEGVTVELRSLTFAEVQGLRRTYKDDEGELTFGALRLGLLSPKLDEAQIEQLRNSKPGPIAKIAGRIMQISGMVETDANLPGGGSSGATGPA